MKRILFCIMLVLSALFSCTRDEMPPKLSYEFSDVRSFSDFTSCTITCHNESVDGEGIKARLLLSENEDLSNATRFPMQISGDTLMCNLTDLQRGTLYYYGFEMFTNTENHLAKEVYNFKTREGDEVTVTTFEVTNITPTTAMGGGNVTINGDISIQERGVCWSLHHNPLHFQDSHNTNGSGSGWFSVNMAGLLPDTTYYVKAYAVFHNGVAYGNEVSFTTPRTDQPVVITGQITNITSTSAIGNGTIVSEGNSPVIERGICWNTNHNPTIWNNHTSNGSGLGSFSCAITGLTSNQTYYVRAYAITEQGVTFGTEVSFMALEGLSEVTTLEITDITTSSAIGKCKVVGQGGSAVTERGICWSNSQNPTIIDNHIAGGSGIGNYSVEMTGLQANATYFARAYATNNAGTVYGEELSFTTMQELTLPTVSTAEVTNITQTTATGGGNVTSSGGTNVMERGICWSTSHNPTTSNSHASNGADTGFYTVNITGLTANTTYYVRAYAINGQGTAYGSEVSFSTSQAPSYTISVSASPSGGGSVSGGGTYQQGQSCTAHAMANSGYTFTNWTENGNVVSTNVNYTFPVTGNRTLVANFNYNGGDGNVPTGAINGLFTINANGDQVYFSQGNLQYQASTNTWRFAENQWDYVGSTCPQYGQPNGTVNGSSNHLISPNYSGWIDLFSWGTSGYNHGAVCYQPWSTSNNSGDYFAYGSEFYHLYNQTGQADWGYNAISNGGNQTNHWRTMTTNEWDYVISTRSTASNIRYAKAQVNSVNGIIILPDNWTISSYSLNSPDTFNVPYDINSISSTQWQELEMYGAVFLPAAGYRSNLGIYCQYPGVQGCYWSSSYSSYPYYPRAHAVLFNNTEGGANAMDNRESGNSIRLVQDYNR